MASVEVKTEECISLLDPAILSPRKRQSMDVPEALLPKVLRVLLEAEKELGMQELKLNPLMRGFNITFTQDAHANLILILELYGIEIKHAK